MKRGEGEMLKPNGRGLRLRLNETVNRVKRTLRLGRPRFPIRIAQVLKSGEMELTGADATTDHLLRAAGRCLDRAASHDIIGEVVFKGRDGRHYVMTVEAVISEVNPAYLKEVLEVIEEDEAEFAAAAAPQA